MANDDAMAVNEHINLLFGALFRKPAPPMVKNERSIDQVQTLDESGKRLRSVVDILVDIGQCGDLFHSPDGEPYARVMQGEHAALHAINSPDYAEYLAGVYYAITGKGASRSAIADALATIAAAAKYNGPTERIWLRVAKDRGRILIDSGEVVPRCYECTAAGWQILDYHPVNFRRSGKPLALPRPTFAEFTLIRKYINVERAELPLIGGFLLAAYRPDGPFPLLLYLGEQGTAKTTAARITKMLVDPSEVPLRAPARDEKDMLIAAINSWVLALDNLSGIEPWLSDALCRISTGGGLSARKLYSDDVETLIEVQRPVVLNGIDDVASRPDLAERCVHITMRPVTERKTEAELKASFEDDAPRIFAALLDGICMALRDVGTIKVPNKPRMADFAEWAAAGMPALGFTAEEFLTAYRRNSEAAVELGLDTSPLARALQQLLRPGTTWTGSANDLLAELTGLAAMHERNSGQWPRSAKGLLTMLRRLAPSLRHIGIRYEQQRSAKARLMTLTREPDASSNGHIFGDASQRADMERPEMPIAAAIFD